MTYSAWNNDPAFQAAAIKRSVAHRKADEYISGTYGRFDNQGRFIGGCSVSCTMHDLAQMGLVPDDDYSDHDAMAEALNVPPWFPRIVDILFESLEGDEQRRFTKRWQAALKPGVNLEPMGYEMAARCLDRCVGYIGDGDEPWRKECRSVVTSSAEVLRCGRLLNEQEAAKASKAAWAARAACVRGEKAVRAVYAAEAANTANTSKLRWAAKAEWAEWAAKAAGEAEAVERYAQLNDFFELLDALGGVENLVDQVRRGVYGGGEMIHPESFAMTLEDKASRLRQSEGGEG